MNVSVAKRGHGDACHLRWFFFSPVRSSCQRLFVRACFLLLSFTMGSIVFCRSYFSLLFRPLYFILRHLKSSVFPRRSSSEENKYIAETRGAQLFSIRSFDAVIETGEPFKLVKYHRYVGKGQGENFIFQTEEREGETKTKYLQACLPMLITMTLSDNCNT